MKKRHWTIGRLCFDLKVEKKHWWWIHHHRYPWFRIRCRMGGTIEVISCLWVMREYPFYGTLIKYCTSLRFQFCWRRKRASK